MESRQRISQDVIRKEEYYFAFQITGYLLSVTVLCNLLVKVTSQNIVDKFSTCLIAIRARLVWEGSTN